MVGGGALDRNSVIQRDLIKMGLKGSWRCFPVTRSLMKNGKGEEREREERGKERKGIWGCERDLYRDEPDDLFRDPPLSLLVEVP